MPKEQTIPTHDLEKDEDHDDVSFRIIKLETKSAYEASLPHRHSYYEIFFFEKGKGSHMIDFETIEIEKGSIHFVSPGQVHLVNRSLDSHGYVLLFNSDFFYYNIENKNTLTEFPFLHGLTSEPAITLKDSDLAFITKIISDINSEFNSGNEYKDDIIRSYLNILLLKCKSPFATGAHENISQTLVNRFRLKVEEKFLTLHKVNDYADLLAITPNHLNDTTKKITGKTALELIQDRLILEAKRLLLHTEQSAKEISYQLGYNDPSYFTRFFKTQTERTPDDFRRQIREKYHN